MLGGVEREPKQTSPDLDVGIWPRRSASRKPTAFWETTCLALPNNSSGAMRARQSGILIEPAKADMAVAQKNVPTWHLGTGSQKVKPVHHSQMVKQGNHSTQTEPKRTVTHAFRIPGPSLARFQVGSRSEARPEPAHSTEELEATVKLGQPRAQRMQLSHVLKTWVDEG